MTSSEQYRCRSSAGKSCYADISLLDISFAQIFLTYVVLLFSLTVHETAHAWIADRFGDPTARRLGRVSLNPLVHVDLIGTVLLPLVALGTGAPLIGWAKPVPVDVRQLRNPRRDYILVAAAGPAIFEDDGLALHVAEVAQPLPQRVPGQVAEETDPGDRLRAGGERRGEETEGENGCERGAEGDLPSLHRCDPSRVLQKPGASRIGIPWTALSVRRSASALTT